MARIGKLEKREASNPAIDPLRASREE